MILNILYELTRNIQCGYHNPVGKSKECIFVNGTQNTVPYFQKYTSYSLYYTGYP